LISLKDKYQDEAIWIVGRGPSLSNIKKEHFGDGPVITINQAIVQVEELHLSNPIYSLQKNGGPKRHNIPNNNLSPDCRQECLDICGNMVRPKTSTLIVHNLESYYCFDDYSPRHVFYLEDFGIKTNTCSVVIAVNIGKLFGCAQFNMISFDTHVYRKNKEYLIQIDELKPHIEGLDIKWIIP